MPSNAEHTNSVEIALSGAAFDQAEIDRLAPILGAFLRTIEASHLVARHEIALLRREDGIPAPEDADFLDADGEFAFMLYWLHYPPPDVQSFIDSNQRFAVLWATLQSAAPQPAYTPDTFAVLCSDAQGREKVWISPGGNIISTDKYEMLDPGWAWAGINYVYTKWRGDEVTSIGDASTSPIALESDCNSTVRIAIIGDWGTGSFEVAGVQPAVEVMRTIANLHEPVDYIIHLGDTYYCGTGPDRHPEGEEQANLVDTWLGSAPKLTEGHAFTLNSNHEMYDGANGLFGTALSNPLFCGQDNSSYFALTFGDWVIVGLDSARYDPSSLYMKGGLGGKDDPQYAFLEKARGWGKKSIFLSHHTAISTDGRTPMPMLANATESFTPDYWYWGHVHLGIVYADSSAAGQAGIKARCIGHSAIPFGAPTNLPSDKSVVEWYARTPLVNEDGARRGSAELGLPTESYRAKNGFAILTLSTKNNDLKEEIYDMGCKHPVWTSKD